METGGKLIMGFLPMNHDGDDGGMALSG